MLILAVALAALTVVQAVPAPPGDALRRRLAPDAPARRVRPRLLWAAGVVAGGALAAGLAGLVAGARGVVVVLAGLVAVGTVARLVVQQAGSRRILARRSEVAVACGALAAHLRIGQMPTAALHAAAQECLVLEESSRVAELGGGVVAVWRAQAWHPGCAGLGDLARAWEVSTLTGAPLADALDRVATALADDQRLRAVVASELSGPRASGRVMAALPLLGIGLGYTLGGDPLTWLLAGPMGWGCLLAGAGLAAVGVLWIERLARQAAAQ